MHATLRLCVGEGNVRAIQEEVLRQLIHRLSPEVQVLQVLRAMSSSEQRVQLIRRVTSSQQQQQPASDTGVHQTCNVCTHYHVAQLALAYDEYVACVQA